MVCIIYFHRMVNNLVMFTQHFEKPDCHPKDSLSQVCIYRYQNRTIVMFRYIYPRPEQNWTYMSLYNISWCNRFKMAQAALA